MVKLGHNNITTYLVFRPPMHLMTLLQIKLDIHMTTPKTSFYYDSNKLGSIAHLKLLNHQFLLKSKKLYLISTKNKLKAKTKSST